MKPFDPIKLAKQTERIVCKGTKRKYDSIHMMSPYFSRTDLLLANPNHQVHGICLMTTGCNLRCYFCSTGKSRDYPGNLGTFLSPQEVASKIEKCVTPKLKRITLGGGEASLSKAHLLKLLDIMFHEKSFKCTIELLTNGILLGNDKEYVKKLSEYPFLKFAVHIGLKAGTPGTFQKRCGAKGEYYELPFKAVENCLDEGILTIVSIMSDTRIMPKQECKAILERLWSIDVTIPQSHPRNRATLSQRNRTSQELRQSCGLFRPNTL